jgi:hypothetical protein
VSEYNLFVVHAGVLPTRTLFEQDRNTYLYTRFVNKDTYERLHLGPYFTKPANSVHWTEIYKEKVNIIYGHDVQSMSHPVIKTNIFGAKCIGIDTGAVFGGKLTAMVFTQKTPDGEAVQIESKFMYKNYKINK